MEDPVVPIRRKYLDNVQWHSTRSTCWFNLDHEQLKINFSTLDTDFYKKRFENNIEGQYIETYKTFVVPFDNTKLNLSMLNE